MDKVRYAGNKFNQKQLYAAIKCITENWWVLCKKGDQFQKEFAKIIGRKYGVFVNSGSSANLLAVYYAKKMGYKKVITPVCGFPTTINPIIQLGLQPIFIDVDRNSLNLNLEQLQKAAIQNPESVLLFAHAFGNPAEMEIIMQIVEQNKLFLIEDCCDALGSSYLHMYQKENKTIKEYRKVGTFGDISTYSFYPAHHITTGEGGFIGTNDYQMYKTLISFRDWGRDCTCRGKEDSIKQNGKCGMRYGKWLPGAPDLIWDHRYVYSEIGFNLKPLQLQAVIGLQQIKKIPQFQKIRQRNYQIIKKFYDTNLTEYFQHPIISENALVCWFCFPLTLKQNAPFTRYDIVRYLEQNGVDTRVYFGGNILYQKAYKDILNENWNNDYNIIKESFPNADYLTRNTFFIGVSQIISEEQIEYICQKIKEFMEKSL